MFLKKWLCVFLVLLMVFSLMLGCTKKDVETESTKEPATATKETVEETSQEKEEDEAPLEISVVMSHGNNAYLASSTDINQDKYVQKVNEMANVKLDISFIDHNQYADQYNLIYASGDIPDIMVHNAGGAMLPVALNAVKEGVFLNIKPYINEEHTPRILELIPEVSWDFADVIRDGGIYFMPGYVSAESQFCTYVRSDLLEKYNLDIPDTLDDYLNVLRVFKENGVKYPYAGREGFAFTYSFFGAFGAIPGMYVFDDDGKIVPSAVTPAMKDALEFHRMMYEEGLIDPEFLSTTGSVWLTEKVDVGDVGVFNHMVARYPLWINEIKAYVPDAELIMLPGPAGPEGYRKGWGAEHPIPFASYINADVKEPQRLMDYIEWMASDDAIKLVQLGLEGDDYEVVDGETKWFFPDDAQKMGQMDARGLLLGMMDDKMFNKLLIPYVPAYQHVLDYVEKYDDIYRPYLMLLGEDLEVYNTRPELNCDGGKNSLWLEMAAQIIYGKEPIDYFDEWVETWMARGGDTVLQQLEAKRMADLYVEID